MFTRDGISNNNNNACFYSAESSLTSDMYWQKREKFTTTREILNMKLKTYTE